MYVNNIYNVTENLSFVLYAEDITSFTTHNTTNILFNRTNIKLSNNDNKLCNWLCLHDDDYTDNALSSARRT